MSARLVKNKHNALTLCSLSFVTLRVIQFFYHFWQVNHLGAEPDTQDYSAWARRLWLGYSPARIRGLAVFAECLAKGTG